jgi:hypothetical protein
VCRVDLGRQILRESSCTDENRNGNGIWKEPWVLPHRQDCVPHLELRDGWLPFNQKTERCDHMWSPSSMLQRPSQACVQDRRGWHREPSLSSGDPEIEDNCFLVHQATDPKRSSLMPFFPKRGQGKVLNSLSGFDCIQPYSSCLDLLTPRACGAPSLMARCTTPDVGHPIEYNAEIGGLAERIKVVMRSRDFSGHLTWTSGGSEPMIYSL